MESECLEKEMMLGVDVMAFPRFDSSCLAEAFDGDERLTVSWTSDGSVGLDANFSVS